MVPVSNSVYRKPNVRDLHRIQLQLTNHENSFLLLTISQLSSIFPTIEPTPFSHEYSIVPRVSQFQSYKFEFLVFGAESNELNTVKL